MPNNNNEEIEQDFQRQMEQLRTAAANVLKGPKMKKSNKKTTLDSECARCGCPLLNHQPNRGACNNCVDAKLSYRGRVCKRFCTREDLLIIQYFEFISWAKKWIKARRSRTITDLRRIWEQIDCDASYCASCPTCKTSIIAHTTTSKNAVKIQDGLACLACKSCVACCKCMPCEKCHRKTKHTNVCPNCSACRDRCCHCRTCSNCGKQCGDDVCFDAGTGNGCGYCNACCSCPDDRRVPYYTSYNRKTKFYKPTLKQHTINPTSRFIAAEIEVATILGRGKPIYSKVKEWEAAVVRDGSLPAGGFEINTAPAGGDVYVKQVNELCKVIEEQSGVVSDRCGLHVHIDARDLSYYDLRRLIRIYAAIETALFSMVNPKRRMSKYCLPCSHKYIAAIEEGRLPYEKVKADVITSVYHASTTQDNRYSKYNNARYNALNLHSWFFRGTIENRMFDGTIDPDLITSWGIMWAMILDHVAAITDDAAATLVRDNSGFGVLATIVSKNPKVLEFVYKRVDEFGTEEIKFEMEKWKGIVVESG